MRFRTPDDGRFRAVGGLFYERFEIYDQGDWFYLTATPYFNPIAPPTGYWSADGVHGCPCSLAPGATFTPASVTLNNPNVRPLGDGYFNDVTRGYTQKAAYTSVDFDILPRVLTVTAGTRYFRTTTSEAGTAVASFGCSLLNPMAAPVPDPCVDRAGVDLNGADLERTYSGFRSRANLSWKPTDSVLLYYTWSQGFRSGGFNRGLSGTTPDSPLSQGPASWQQQASLHKGWTPPQSFAPDNLINNEIGWKTGWFDRRLQWNGSVYQEDWKQAQVSPFGALLTGGGIFNGGDYRVRGVGTSAAARIADGLSVDAGAAWNHGELVREAPFYWNDGYRIDFAMLTNPNGSRFLNPAGTAGTSLHGAPAFQGNINARYDMPLGDYQAFVQVGAVHQSHSFSADGVLLPGQQLYSLPPFTNYSAALGASKDGWLVQLYGENLTDSRAQLYASYYLYYKSVTVSRPRTLGVRLSYRVGP